MYWLLLCASAASAGLNFLHAPQSRALHVQRRAASASDAGAVVDKAPPPLEAEATPALLKAQNSAGRSMRELGQRLKTLNFEGEALDGEVRATFDGLQRLKKVDISGGAGGTELADALLSALQAAHDASVDATGGDVWNLYQDNPDLMQAPLVQIGAGNTGEDLWANVKRTEETEKLALELFTKFDADGDGFWNLKETCAVQLATEGTEIAEDAFNALIIATAPDGGRNLSETDLAKGLSKEQVIELYTDAERQKKLGFVLDINKDHAAAFKQEQPASEGATRSAELVD